MYIAVDFDGTCVTHEFPDVGKNIGAAPVLKALAEKGHKIILNTMRSSRDAGNIGANGNELHRNVLQEAVNWFKNNNIELFGINHNPTQDRWTSSSKTFAHLYIDDASLGTPLKCDTLKSLNKFVDWKMVLKYFKDAGVFTPYEYYQLEKQIIEDYDS